MLVARTVSLSTTRLLVPNCLSGSAELTRTIEPGNHVFGPAKQPHTHAQTDKQTISYLLVFFCGKTKRRKSARTSLLHLHLPKVLRVHIRIRRERGQASRIRRPSESLRRGRLQDVDEYGGDDNGGEGQERGEPEQDFVRSRCGEQLGWRWGRGRRVEVVVVDGVFVLRVEERLVRLGPRKEETLQRGERHDQLEMDGAKPEAKREDESERKDQALCG